MKKNLNTLKKKCVKGYKTCWADIGMAACGFNRCGVISREVRVGWGVMGLGPERRLGQVLWALPSLSLGREGCEVLALGFTQGCGVIVKAPL